MRSFYDDYYNNEPTNQYGNSVYNEPVYGTPNMNEPEQPNKFLYEAGKSLRNCFWLYIANYGISLLLVIVSVFVGVVVGLSGDTNSITTASNIITIISAILTAVVSIPIAIQFNKLRNYLDSYNKVFWIFICIIILSTIVCLFPLVGVKSTFLSRASSLLSILYGLFLFKANSELVSPYSYDLSNKWSNLWKWFIYPIIGIFALVIFICFGLRFLAVLGIIVALGIVLVGVVLQLVYLWQTSSLLIAKSNYR